MEHLAATTTLPPLTTEELHAVTIVFHQYETGLREGCIFTKVITKPNSISITKATKTFILLFVQIVYPNQTKINKTKLNQTKPSQQLIPN